MRQFFDVVDGIQHVDQEVDTALMELHGIAPQLGRMRDRCFQQPALLACAGNISLASSMRSESLDTPRDHGTLSSTLRSRGAEMRPPRRASSSGPRHASLLQALARAFCLRRWAIGVGYASLLVH